MKNVILAVNGTFMRGLELENNLKEVNAVFLKESKTAPCFRLYSIDDKYPAMIEDIKGASIDVELYLISEEGMKEVLSKEPDGLTIDKIKLLNGEEVCGVIGLSYIVKGRKEITSYGGWRNYIKDVK